MCDDEIFGLIEKEIVVKEHNEANEQTSSLNISPVKKKSAILGKERECNVLATKESLAQGISKQMKEEVPSRCYGILNFIFYNIL